MNVAKIGIAGPVETALLVDFLRDVREDAPCGLGGISVTHLVKGLLLEGCRVSVYTLDTQVSDPVVLAGDRLTIYYGPFRRRRRMRDLMKAERKAIWRFIAQDRPDLIHAHWTYEFAWGALGHRIPTLITVRDWGPAILRQRPDLYRAGRLVMGAVTLARGRHFVANSPYIQRHVQRFTARPVPVIPNGIDDALFEEEKPWRSTDAPVVLSVNNGFGRRKNVHALLEAFQAIRARLPRCRLRLLGYGFEAGGDAAQWARARGLDRGVDFEGYVPYRAVLDAMREADVLVHPALEESFGMTLLEAMAKGTPVVGGKKSGAVPWVLDGGRAGLLVDVATPRDVAAATLLLLTDARAWRHYSEAGLAYAWRHFRLSHVTARYLEQYHQLLPAPRMDASLMEERS